MCSLILGFATEELNTEALMESETDSPLCCSYSRIARSQSSRAGRIGSFNSTLSIDVNIAVNRILCRGSHSSQKRRQTSRPLPTGAARSFSKARSLTVRHST